MDDLEQRFQLLLERVNYLDQRDVDKIKEAWQFAKIAHSGQFRKNGDPYVSHVLSVAEILVEWKLDCVSIISGLLHDTVEDGITSNEDVLKSFGEEVSLLVDGVTKVREVRLQGDKGEVTIENLRKLILVMAKDLRVVIVKFADRLHNMRTLEFLSEEKQRENAKETLEIYAPLAERMGMGEVKGQLEDLSFRFLYPIEYKNLILQSKEPYSKAERNIKKMKRFLLADLANRRIRVKISGRKKHLYSLWSKLNRPGIDGDYTKIHDIVALRILVDTVDQCYVALGLVHQRYKPIPNIGISDFISQPKPNGYQSIHTKVFGPNGKTTEIQIRTYAMHDQAEHGAASHWAYSDAKLKGVSDEKLENTSIIAEKSKLDWVKQLVSWQDDIRDHEKFMEAVKFDAFAKRNFIFSPKGDVYDLPVGSTPVDYAVAVHTQLVWHVRGAKVNGIMVPLDYKLKSGDIVEIIKTKNKVTPNKGWLDFVVTHEARKQIRMANSNLT